MSDNIDDQETRPVGWIMRIPGKEEARSHIRSEMVMILMQNNKSLGWTCF
jgi:hypothetical protein